MTSFTLSLPDDTYHRIAEIAQIRGISIGDLFGGVATALVTEADAEARFRAHAQRGLGKAERGLGLLGRYAIGEVRGTPMRVELTDQAALRRLPWEGLKSYLDAQGWRQVDHIGDKALVYVPDETETEAVEILVPTRYDLGDYVSRMAEAVHILADLEHRSALDVYQDILTSSPDEERLQIPEADQKSGGPDP